MAMRQIGNGALTLVLLCVGSLVTAIAVNGVLLPRGFLSGGFTGLALLVHYLVPAWPVSLLYLLLNLPLYVLGWRFVGRRFFAWSVAGALILAAALQWVQPGDLGVQDRILAALLAGILVGGGTGLVLRSLGSSGGTDILAVILYKRFSLKPGSTVLGFNSMVLVGAAFLISLEGALYTLIYLFASAKITNLVVVGLSQRKAVFIISTRWREIADGILHRIHRGATILEGQGAYSGEPEHVVYAVIQFSELPRIKELVRLHDPNAFMVVTDTLEVMGRRIGNQPHW